MWVRYLAHGYLRSGIKLFWHLPCFVCTRTRTENPPLLNPAPIRPRPPHHPGNHWVVYSLTQHVLIVSRRRLAAKVSRFLNKVRALAFREPLGLKSFHYVKSSRRLAEDVFDGFRRLCTRTRSRLGPRVWGFQPQEV